MANITPNNSQIQKVIVAKAGTDTATRKRLNFIEGSNITITVADNPGSDRVDITFTGSAASAVDSVFGRTGAVTAQSGDYNTSQVSENTNLYYTQGRFDSAFAAKSTSDLAEGSNLYFTDERVDDRVANLLVAGANITLTYNDSLNTLTVASTASGGGLDLVSYSYAGGF